MLDGDSLVRKQMKNKFAAIIVLVSVVVILAVILGVIFITSNRQPENLKETTGTIKKFKQYDSDWLDFIFNTDSYLRIWLDDGRSFETFVISYNNTNRELFKIMSAGGEVKITYDSENGGNHIYALDYNGVNYMPLDAVLNDVKDNSKTMTAAGISIMCVSVVISGVVLSVFGYRYKKKRL